MRHPVSDPTGPAPRLAARGRRACLAVVAGAALCLPGCAVISTNVPHNQPSPPLAEGQEATDPVLPRVEVPSDVLVALSFSGGGLRAAAFADGVMQGLAAQPGPPGHNLLQQVEFITSVSGGSLPAAWVGLHGTDSLAEFRSAALLHAGGSENGSPVSNSVSLLRLAGDGLTQWLDAEVFHGATFADMNRLGRPVVWINATNLNQRLPFAFDRPNFAALCSDIDTYPVADAVAASMAVPLLFSPVVLEKHPESCATALPVRADGQLGPWGDTMLAKGTFDAMRAYRDVSNGRFLKLVDGGLTDNFGLSSIQQQRLLIGTPLAPLDEAQALRLRRLLFVVVDGGRRPVIDWDRNVNGPAGLELALASVDAAIDTNMRLSYDGFLVMSQRWQDDLVKWRCARPAAEQAHEVARRPDWRCEDVQVTVSRISFDDLAPARASWLHTVSTSLTLSRPDVDAVIEAGHDAILANATVHAFAQSLRATPEVQ